MNREIFVDGFLDKEICSSNNDMITKMYRVEFDYAIKLNRYIYSLFDLINDKIKPKKEISDYIVGNYIIIHKSFQSFLILLKHGLQEDALTILRTIQEKLIYMKCADKDEVYYYMLVINNLKEKIKVINMIKNGQIVNPHIDLASKLKEIENEICKLISKINEKLNTKYHLKTKFNIEQFAQIAEMESEYKLMYKVLSEYIHPSLNTLHNNFWTESGFVYHLNPSYKNNHDYIQSSIDLLIRATELVLNHFYMDTKTLKELYNEQIAIWGKSDE